MTKSLINKIASHKYIQVIGFIITLLVLCCIYYIYVWINTQSTDNAYVDADISHVSSEISGVIEHIVVHDNSFVQAGQVIAQINDTDYKAKYEQAKSSLTSSSHNVDLIIHDINVANIRYQKALAEHKFTKKSFNISKIDYDRVSKLNEENFASQKKLDNTTVMYAKEKNDLSQTMFDMQTSQEQIKLLEIKKLIAIVQRNSALQKYLLAKRALDNTNIRSPIDGIIGNSSLRAGNYIRPGVVLFSVVPTDKLYIRANFKETQIAKFRSGMKSTIEIDSIPGVKINGMIRNIAPATGSKFSLLPPANATGNFTKIVQRVPVIIDFIAPELVKNKIVPGMSSTIKIRIDQ